MINAVSSTTPTAAPSTPVKKSDTILSRPFKDYFVVIQEPTEDCPLAFSTTPPELQEEFSAYICARQEEAIAEQRMAAAEARRNPVKLTWEQRSYLRERYDPKDMSRQDYLSFIDDLLEFGILKESEAAYLDCGRGMVPLWEAPQAGTAFRSEMDDSTLEFKKQMFRNPLFLFADCAGNVLDWARYQASYLSYDFTTHTEYQSTQDLAFSKMYRVLREM